MWRRDSASDDSLRRTEPSGRLEISLLPMVASLALKVRPYFESSSDDHRAAAISVYSCLYTDTEDAARYLDYAATILTPVLLHSNSDHDHTR